jgi:hypothetical protein
MLATALLPQLYGKLIWLYLKCAFAPLGRCPVKKILICGYEYGIIYFIVLKMIYESKGVLKNMFLRTPSLFLKIRLCCARP